MILFTADWHLKLRQKNVPLHWAYDRYYKFYELIYEIEKYVKSHIIGGDLFDRVPTMEELELYFEFISNVTIPTFIYDGNHEATKRGQTFFTQLKEVSQKLNPLVMVVDEISELNDCSILPYCKLHEKNSIEELNPDKPLFTHVRGEIPPHVKPEVDLDRFNKFPVVFAGDLHSHSNCQRNIVYPGSPMTTSFHRNEVKTGYILIDDDWSWNWHEFELPQLLRKTVDSEEDMIPSEYHHTIYELEGDMKDLASVKHSDLLDKKVVKRSSEATLILDKNMTIQDELVEYLLYILELDEEKIKETIGTFNDYAKDVKVE